MKEDRKEQPIGTRFQEETKYYREKMTGHVLDWDNLPPPYKNYDNPIRRVSLPEPEVRGDANIWSALQKRRSRRTYVRDASLTQGLLSALLWGTQGSTARWGDTLFRTAPSAGGLYPLETYLYLRAVEGLDRGLYHFRPGVFDLEYLTAGDRSAELAQAALDQAFVAEAQAVFLWSAIVARSRWKYRQRAYRYIYIDAGHICQNLYLVAEALGLGVCAIGAFYDEEVNSMLGLDGVEETTVYMAAVGRPAQEMP